MKFLVLIFNNEAAFHIDLNALKKTTMDVLLRTSHTFFLEGMSLLQR